MSTAAAPKPKTKHWLDLSHAFPVGGSMATPKSVVYHDPSGVLLEAVTLMNANAQKHEPSGTFDRCVLHWTAGGLMLPYDDYHYCQVVDVDGFPVIIRCIAPGAKGQHLYMRNTGAAGFSWCAPGPAAVGAVRLEQMAKLVGEFCHKHGLNPLGKTANGFWVIDDHAAYAAKDYPGERWDVGSQLPDIAPGKPDPRNLMVPLRKKAAWYHGKVEVDANGHAVYEFAAII